MWVLIIMLYSGDGVGIEKVEGFASEAECNINAAKVVKANPVSWMKVIPTCLFAPQLR